ncbi:hypothetical protein RND81_08G009400 [Saponaria officinalis]|uniref:CBF1-interacting co-repressor CIR N-terminal domain-containing protein n=1 Tax=Saponaria officinalis TaxID=3572 RepID=A0AAW1J1X8_SAPOF
MEDEEAGVPKLSKRFADKNGGEVDYKTKSGTAWSHNFLNQKPWHPLSYPNQRRKWIAEQTHAHRQRRTEEVSREYLQEQEFLRQTSLLSQKEKEKVDLMQAVSFMYVRPPGYNAESAKAAEIVEEKRKLGEIDPAVAASSSAPLESAPVKEEKRKSRPKDVFGRSLPTEEEFAVLKNAPKLETGVAGRAKPFAVEVRNVKCVRCATFGHQSGDRECPLKDAIMPNEESRLKRDDPLTTIMAQMDSSEPLKWELKQKPGISPPRGGFQPDDPNQQIVAEDIFDEYGGFLSGGGMPELLTNFSTKKQKKKTKSNSKRKKRRSSRSCSEDSSSDSDNDKRRTKTESKSKRKKRRSSRSCSEDSSSDSDDDKRRTKTESKSKQLKQPSTRSTREGDSRALDSNNGRTISKNRKNRKGYSPARSDEDSYSDEDRRSRKEHVRKRERNKKSSSHFDTSDKSDDERYYTKSQHNRSHRRSGESRKPRNDSSPDGERKLSGKGKRHQDRETDERYPGFSSSENTELDRRRRKYSSQKF